MLIFIEKIVEKKCKEKNIIEKRQLFKKKGFKIAICLFNIMVWLAASLIVKTIILTLLLSILFTLSIMIMIIDIRIHIIPNVLVLVLMAAGAVFQAVHFGWKSLLIASISMLVITAVFIILGLIMGLQKIGAGDVKLAGAMGLVLGYPHILTAILVMAITLLAYCFFGVLFYKLTMKSMFAYAPFMMIGLIVTLTMIAADFSFF